MQKLTPAGEQIIGEIARRHGFSTNAVMSMLESVIRETAAWRNSATLSSEVPASGCWVA